VAVQLAQCGGVLVGIVAQARVGPVRAEEGDNFGMAVHGGAHEWRATAAARLVDGGTSRQQTAARIHVAMHGGAAERGVGCVVLRVRSCAGGEKRVQRRQVAFLCRDDERSPAVV
jgi:hypothetical protein